MTISLMMMRILSERKLGVIVEMRVKVKIRPEDAAFGLAHTSPVSRA